MVVILKCLTRANFSCFFYFLNLVRPFYSHDCSVLSSVYCSVFPLVSRLLLLMYSCHVLIVNDMYCVFRPDI